MSDTIPQSVSSGCRKYVKSRIIINTFNTFNNVPDVRERITAPTPQTISDFPVFLVGRQLPPLWLPIAALMAANCRPYGCQLPPLRQRSRNNRKMLKISYIKGKYLGNRYLPLIFCACSARSKCRIRCRKRGKCFPKIRGMFPKNQCLFSKNNRVLEFSNKTGTRFG